MKIRIFSALITFLILLLPYIGMSQPDPGGGGDKVPITETIVLLLAGGLGLGIKAFSKKKK